VNVKQVEIVENTEQKSSVVGTLTEIALKHEKVHLIQELFDATLIRVEETEQSEEDGKDGYKFDAAGSAGNGFEDEELSD